MGAILIFGTQVNNLLKKSNIYWYCQFIGWSFYIIINTLYFGLVANPGFREYLVYVFMLPTGIGITHIYRQFLIRNDVLNLKIPAQLFYMVVFSFLKALGFYIVMEIVSVVLGISLNPITPVTVAESVINFAVIFFLWNVIYFGFQYFQNYKRSEINSLRYLALSRESELNNLKAQLNPHFIFNCMNSIRALVDEDPQKAKEAVTQLSNILRNTLMMDKSREIALREELKLVNDFLNLEKIRYEERLSYEFRISEEAGGCLIPPFIMQSQVENAIKHGISVSSQPGFIIIEAHTSNGFLIISVSNTGKLNTSKPPETGVGFKNSQQRLELLYGKRASISISEQNNMVAVTIQIPLN